MSFSPDPPELRPVTYSQMREVLQRKLFGVPKSVVPALGANDIAFMSPRCSNIKVPEDIDLVWFLENRSYIDSFPSTELYSQERRDIQRGVWFWGIDPTHSWDPLHLEARARIFFHLGEMHCGSRDPLGKLYLRAWVEAVINPGHFHDRGTFINFWRYSVQDMRDDEIQFDEAQLKAVQEMIFIFRGAVAMCRSYLTDVKFSDLPVRAFTLKLMDGLLSEDRPERAVTPDDQILETVLHPQDKNEYWAALMGEPDSSPQPVVRVPEQEEEKRARVNASLQTVNDFMVMDMLNVIERLVWDFNRGISTQMEAMTLG